MSDTEGEREQQQQQEQEGEVQKQRCNEVGGSGMSVAERGWRVGGANGRLGMLNARMG